MTTFRWGAFKMHGGGTGAVLRAESSHRALDKLDELGLLAPAIELPRAKTVDLQRLAEPAAPQTVERFYPDGLSVERWKFWVFSLPLSLILGLCFYQYFTGSPEWLAGAVMLTSFVVFVPIGLMVERQRLRAFVCPRCQAPIGDWDTNQERRILFNCDRCESRWDIEYKAPPPPPLRLKPVNRIRRSYCSILCSCRGSAPTLQRIALNTKVSQQLLPRDETLQRLNATSG